MKQGKFFLNTKMDGQFVIKNHFKVGVDKATPTETQPLIKERVA